MYHSISIRFFFFMCLFFFIIIIINTNYFCQKRLKTIRRRRRSIVLDKWLSKFYIFLNVNLFPFPSDNLYLTLTYKIPSSKVNTPLFLCTNFFPEKSDFLQRYKVFGKNVLVKNAKSNKHFKIHHFADYSYCYLFLIVIYNYEHKTYKNILGFSSLSKCNINNVIKLSNLHY